LTLVLNEVNDTLGAKNFVILYTPCGSTSCDNASRTITIPIKELEKRPRTIELGRGVLDNILVELETGETMPATRVTATGRGSALLFTWAYPSLRAILYVGLESRQALLSTSSGNTLGQYSPPRGCSLEQYQRDNQVYLLKCDSNIYSKHLVFSKRLGLLKIERITIRDYYCPGSGAKEEYLDLSPMLWALGLAMLVILGLRSKIPRSLRPGP